MIHKRAPAAERIGSETGAMASWLWPQIDARASPVLLRVRGADSLPHTQDTGELRKCFHIENARVRGIDLDQCKVFIMVPVNRMHGANILDADEVFRRSEIYGAFADRKAGRLPPTFPLREAPHKASASY